MSEDIKLIVTKGDGVALPNQSESLAEFKKQAEFINYQEMAIKLWQLLDDIDTAMDMFKPNLEPYERYIASKVSERFNYLTSDGYRLFNLNGKKIPEIKTKTPLDGESKRG